MSSASKGRASICDFHEKNKVQYIIQKMPANVSPCIPVRVKMRLQAAMLWAILSIPSILVTIILFISTNKSEFKKVSTTYYVFYFAILYIGISLKIHIMIYGVFKFMKKYQHTFSDILEGKI